MAFPSRNTALITKKPEDGGGRVGKGWDKEKVAKKTLQQ